MDILLVIFCMIYITEENREVIKCGDIPLNISCENDTVIEMLGVQYGPLFSNQNITSDGQSMDIKWFEERCNDKNYCYLNNTEVIGFDSYEGIPRSLNISYNCDFIYLGCYKDNNIRLLTTGSLIKTGNMSALICRIYCATQLNTKSNYFGTENSDECFCGTDDDFKKISQPRYKWFHTSVCNAKCAKHPEEICGRNGYISVYSTTTTTFTKTKMTKATEDRPFLTCNYSANVKNVNIRVQVSKICNESELVDIFGQHAFTCNENNFCYGQSFSDLEWDFKKNITKYLKINYSCKAKPSASTEREDFETNKSSEFTTIPSASTEREDFETNESSEFTTMPLLSNEQEDSETKDCSELIGIVGGAAAGGTCLICVIFNLIVVCKCKRRKHKNTKSVETILESGQTIENASTKLRENKNLTGSSNSRKDTYSVVSLPKEKMEAKQQTKMIKETNDLYADNVEGVYDVSNKPMYKQQINTDQAIYSHAVDGVYDTTVPNTRKSKEENTYDQGFYPAQENEYELSSV